MAQIREIKKRMIAVRTIQRITKTMQMIATAKFTAALQRSKATRPYTERIRALVAEVAAAAGDVVNPLLGGRGKSVGKELLLVVSSDRGLCGAYNGSILRAAMAEIRKRRGEKREMIVETAGKKAVSYFRFQRVEIAERHAFGDKPSFAAVAALADRYMADYTAGKVDAVYVAYMRFASTSRQVAEIMQLLPLTLESGLAVRGAATVYEYRPSAEALLDELLPKSVKVSLFQAMNDAIVSENVMRMVAMKAATDNASGLGRTLKRNYNRARQAKITTELTEIVSGAAALE
ncbi:MAG: ATP synthase F1 subunit gamma [Phycisphaerales bacterium]|nr:ATP synthase F1 subunit gamma [Phycisphaerales bacterium]